MSNNFKNKTIIFLDIDEVLATENSSKMKRKFWYDDKSYPFDAKCVKNLNVILRTINAEIILSSSWRLFYTLDELDKIFKFNKVEKSPIGITNERGDRNAEIEEFVNNNNIREFLIVDDMELKCFPDKFLRIRGKKGLTQEHIETAIKMIDKQFV